MITNMLENDLYKFTMGQVVNYLFPDVVVEYEFTNRGKTQFPIGFDKFLQERVENCKHIKLISDEKAYLKSQLPFLSEPYLNFLENFRFNPNEVLIEQIEHDLKIKVIGHWSTTIYWEVVLMAIISQLYFEMTNQKIKTREERFLNNTKKIRRLAEAGLQFADFGLRRRFSRENHIEVIKDFIEYGYKGFIGTSNVSFAKQFGIKPIGTMAHEFIVAESALRGVRYANKYAMEDWTRIYRGNLGIVLTDTFGVDGFLKDFDRGFACMFDGTRHDSNCPYKYTDKIIEHYKKNKIDPMSKTIVFSDGLDVDKAIDIHKYCEGKIKDSYGIGTFFTNDVDVKALNIVIKLRTVNNIPVAKLSDIAGKETGHPKGIQIAKLTYDRE